VVTGQRIVDYDVSRDEARVAFTVVTGDESQIYLAATDRSSPPRPVVRGGDMVTFGAGNLFFRQLGGKGELPGAGSRGRERADSYPGEEDFRYWRRFPGRGMGDRR
jgi:hypothetical protein